MTVKARSTAWATSPQLAGSWRARPPPPGLAARKPRPHALSPRAGRARLVRPQPLPPAAPAACAAGDCLLPVKSTRHVPASRGMQGREKRRDEVVNLSLRTAFAHTRTHSQDGLASEGEGVWTFCSPTHFLSRALNWQVRESSGRVYPKSVCVCLGVRAQAFSRRESVSLTPKRSLRWRIGAEVRAVPGASRAQGGRLSSPALQAGGLWGTLLGTVERERSLHSACQGALLPPAIS